LAAKPSARNSASDQSERGFRGDPGPSEAPHPAAALVPRVHDQRVYLARPPRGRMVCKGGWLLPGAAARQASDARRATRRDPPDRSRCAGNLVETASPGAPPSLASLAKAHRPKVSEATASKERRAASWPKPKLSRWVTTGTSSSPASLKAALCLGQRGPARLPASPRRAGGRIQAGGLAASPDRRRKERAGQAARYGSHQETGQTSGRTDPGPRDATARAPPRARRARSGARRSGFADGVHPSSATGIGQPGCRWFWVSWP
jgi:hypothetical protein